MNKVSMTKVETWKVGTAIFWAVLIVSGLLFT